MPGQKWYKKQAKPSEKAKVLPSSKEADDQTLSNVSFDALEGTAFEPQEKSVEDKYLEEESTKTALGMIMHPLDEIDRKILIGLEDGLSIGEIARKLNMKPGAVSTRRNRLKEKVGIALENMKYI